MKAKHALWVASGATVILFIAMAWLGSCLKEQWSVSDVGSFLSAVGTFAAFIWLIATAILQNSDLKLQHRETKRLADEARVQGAALRASARSFFVERWERSIHLFLQKNDESLAAVADQLQDAWLNGQDVTALKKSAEDHFQQKYPTLQISVGEPSVWPLTGMSIDRDGSAKIILGASASMSHQNNPLAGQSGEAPVPFDVSWEEVRAELAKNGVDLGLLTSLVEEALDIGLGAMLSEPSIAAMFGPSAPAAKQFRRISCDLTEFCIRQIAAEARIKRGASESA